ncbi:MAG: PIG-L family deacetylase, partial [Verrucomicrobiota bacterium]|nr:PIG-L family deacetylase [Verrucomicrobiota bacterium]
MNTISRILAWTGLALALSASLLQAATQPLLLGDDDQRILVLAPHPDDETLGAGGLIQEAVELDIPIQICFFTMGDNNELAFIFTRKRPVIMPGAVRQMGVVRQKEAIAAATQLGLSTNHLVFLGYPDYGTLTIWNAHWRDRPPFRSMLTKVTAVPYDDVLTPGAAYSGEDILEDLCTVIRDFRPTHIVVSHSADHNVDHRALYLFTRVALWELEKEGLCPQVLSYPVHFTHWPAPRRYHPDLTAVAPKFLQEEIDWHEYSLAPYQVTNKLAALRRHHSQYLYSGGYLSSFVRKSEIFGDFENIVLPNASGAVQIPQEDDTQYEVDPDLIQDLTQTDTQWNELAEQNNEENAEVADADNEFEERNISGDGVYLTFSFKFHRTVARSAILRLQLFGWREDVPFSQMPKIAIEISPRRVASVKDLDQRLPVDEIELLPSAPNVLAVRVPIDLLGDPAK